MFVECYNKSQGIVLLQVYDRSMSQNSCARTDIILKRGSRAPPPKQQQPSSNNNEHRQEIPPLPSLPSVPPSVPSSTAMMMMGIKQEDRNLSVRLSKKKNSSSKLLNLVFRNYPFLWIKGHHYIIHLVHHHHHHFHNLILIMIHY